MWHTPLFSNVSMDIVPKKCTIDFYCLGTTSFSIGHYTKGPFISICIWYNLSFVTSFEIFLYSSHDKFIIKIEYIISMNIFHFENFQITVYEIGWSLSVPA